MTTAPTWPTCEVDPPCTGIRVEGFRECLAHLARKDLDLFLSRLKPGSDLDARGTTISDDLLARLEDGVRLEHGEPFFGDVNFDRARFAVGAGFMEAAFRHASFVDAEFENIVKLGPLAAHTLTLDRARFAHSALIEVHASEVSCIETRFDGGVTLRVRYANIDATDVVFGSTSSITTSLGYVPLNAMEHLHRWNPPAENAQPKLVSLRGADVSNLVLVDVDLSWCLFVGAYRLDQLRLEGRCQFNSPPSGWRWTRRQMLAEEHFSRKLQDEHPALPGNHWISSERLAVLYRSLRKAFEDSKNEAGAGDFYYGEMEARRHSQATPRTERRILWTYWWLSGYGQRGDRAVAALGVLVAVVCLLLFAVGLPGGLDWNWARVDQSLRIGTGAVVFRDAGQQLTSAGSWTVMTARFLGPVLLALAVLAVRARVKR